MGVCEKPGRLFSLLQLGEDREYNRTKKEVTFGEKGLNGMENPGAPLVQIIEVTMPTRLGFHLRVVARFVKNVRQFRSIIRVRKGKITADGKNVLGLLLLAVAWKSTLYIEAEGEDAERAIASVKTFFQMEKE